MSQKFKSQIDAEQGIKITNELYDGSAAAGSSGQVLSSTGSATQWIDFNSDTAERIQVTVKNVSGGSLSKGTVVHAAPTATPPSGNVIEVIAADANVAASMPAIGVLNETIADEAEGAAVMFGAVSGIDTSSFSIGDELYVSTTAGEFTATKPTANDELVQKVAIVIKSHASNGLIKVFGAGRANDVPNRVDRNMNFTDDSELTFGDSDDASIKWDSTAEQLFIGGQIKFLDDIYVLGKTNLNDADIDDTLAFYVSSTDAARQRADARDDDTNYARLHWFGKSDDGSTSNFRHAYYDGAAYINVTAQNNILTYTGALKVAPASGDGILFLQSTSQALRIDQNSLRTTTNTQFTFMTNSTSALQLDTSQNAIFYANLYMPQYLKHSGDEDTYLQFQTDRQTLVAGGTEFIDFANTTQDYITIGGGSDIDIKLVSSTNNKYIFIQGSDGKIGINDQTPSYAFDVNAETRFGSAVNFDNTRYNKGGSATFWYATTTGARVNMDARVDGTGVVIHKWNRNADDNAYLSYAENWYDGNSYHKISAYNNGFMLNGNIRFESYGAGNITGTLSRLVGFEANGGLIDVPLSTFIDGSGVAGRIPYFTDASSLTSSSLFFENSDKIRHLQTIGPNDDVRKGFCVEDQTSMAANVGGQLTFRYMYTTSGSMTEGAMIRMYKLNATDGDYSSGLKFQVRNTGDGLSSKMTLNPSGFLGLGTTDPDVHLHINSGDDEGWVYVQATGTNAIAGLRTHSSTGGTTNTLYRNITSNLLTLRSGTDDGEIQFIAGGSAAEAMRIDSSQRVGIGTANPYGRLELSGNGNSWGAGPAIRMWDTTNSKGWLVGNINNYTAGDFYIRTLPSESGNPGGSQLEFTIKHASGYVGIGRATGMTSLLNFAANQNAADAGADNWSGSAINTFGGDIATGRLMFQGHQQTGNDTIGINVETSNRAVLYNYTDNRYLQIWDDDGDIEMPSGSLGIGVSPDGGNGGLLVTKTNGTFANSNQKRVASFYDGSVNSERPGIILGYDDSSTPHGIIAARTQSGTATIPGLQFFTYNGSSWGPRMTILANGRVGIGDTNPNYKLTVSGDSSDWNTAYITNSNTTGTGLSLRNTSTGVTWSAIAQGTGGGADDNNLAWHLTDAGTSGAALGYKMTLTASGNLGIGLTNPQFGLSMAQGTGDGSRIGWNDGAGDKRASIICSSSTDALQFHTGTSDTERMRIESDGDIILYEGNFTMSGATPFIVLSNTAETESGITFLDSADAGQSAKITYDASSNLFKFYNNASNEAMVIDNGGRLLINSTSNQTNQPLQVNGFIDITNVNESALRFYNGSTFRGGFGLSRWGVGASVVLNDADMVCYAVGNLDFVTSGGSAAKARITMSGSLVITGGVHAFVGGYEGIKINVPSGTKKYVSFWDSGTTTFGGGMWYDEASNITSLYSLLRWGANSARSIR